LVPNDEINTVELVPETKKVEVPSYATEFKVAETPESELEKTNSLAHKGKTKARKRNGVRTMSLRNVALLYREWGCVCLVSRVKAVPSSDREW